jgi:integrase
VATLPELLQKVDRVECGKAPANAGWSAAKTALDASLNNAARWTPHDLRRTMAAGMGELGVQAHIIEAAVHHQSGHTGVAGTYMGGDLLRQRAAYLSPAPKLFA